jgi:hypothetical protein
LSLCSTSVLGARTRIRCAAKLEKFKKPELEPAS